MKSEIAPIVLGLFQKRINGDDALLELAQKRFAEAGLGMEVYAESAAQLREMLTYKPKAETPVAVHLPRWIDMFRQGDARLICELAKEFRQDVIGFVAHDQPELASDRAAYIKALQHIDQTLAAEPDSPFLFVEYAVMHNPGEFTDFAREIAALRKVSICLDIGHLGIWQVRENCKPLNLPGDVCAIHRTDPDLPSVIESIQQATEQVPDMVAATVDAVCAIGKPVHFHLHDAHPLSDFSPFGVSDHLDFFIEIPIPFSFRGKKSLPPMYGPRGLKKILTAARHHLPPEKLSFTLEIHPMFQRESLGRYRYLFKHWRDLTNAEQMNYWLSTLVSNLALVSGKLGSDPNFPPQNQGREHRGNVAGTLHQ